MKIGVAKEIKNNENRVALTPAGVDRLQSQGHSILVEKGAGLGSALSDEAYLKAGAQIAPDAATVWAKSDMVLKVKEPLATEWPHMKKGQTLFTYLHLAADKKLTEGCAKTGSYCFAYETLEHAHTLPLLVPMSEVAGRMAIQAGAKFLEAPAGGSGILLGGVPGVRPAKVLIIGGGVVGTQAARMAAGLGADVTILDINLDRMRYLDEILPANCRTVYSTPHTVREALPETDLVVGAILIPGAAAPKVIKREDLKLMRKGSVIVDVAVDQGGCIETVRPTTHAEPTYVIDGVIHYCVANMPGAVPRTSTFALTNATLPWVEKLAKLGPIGAIEKSPELMTAANVSTGRSRTKPSRRRSACRTCRPPKWSSGCVEPSVGARRSLRAADVGAANHVDAWQALVLGVVEGVTEYLPVSSTGHLILTERVLGIGASTNANAFAVVIQSGAILAVLSIYLPRAKQMIAGIFGRDPIGRRLALQIAVAFMPAALIGLVFKKTIEAHLFGLWPVVIAWFVGGVVILGVRRLREGNRDGAGIESITYPVALAIGFCQALALAPGTSRSLVTIGGALLLGLSGAAAVEFSMLLGVVTLLAATVHEAHAAGASMLHEYGATNLALGFLAAFVSAFLAVKWLLTWLRSRGLFVFGVYRIALAAIVAVLLWQGVIAAR